MARDALGRTREFDSETPPWTSSDFPWPLAIALAVAYFVGAFGWHWSYVLPVFWLLYKSDEQRRRTNWAVLQVDAATVAARSRDDETVTWLNQLLRATWPMYEPPVARYLIAVFQPIIDAYVPRSIGVFSMRIKKFTFGNIESRRADRPHRLAPLIFEKVAMVSKSVDASSRDPKQHRIKCVLQADVRWHAGSAPALVLDIQLGPKLLSLSVDAQVAELTVAGTLRIETEWLRAFPYLGTASFAFVRLPAIDFKLSLGGSPDVMDLAPPLRTWLKNLLDTTVTNYMLGANQFVVPLYEWYGEPAAARRASGVGAAATSAAAGAAAVRASHRRVPGTREDRAASLGATVALGAAAAGGGSHVVSGAIPHCSGGSLPGALARDGSLCGGMSGGLASSSASTASASVMAPHLLLEPSLTARPHPLLTPHGRFSASSPRLRRRPRRLSRAPAPPPPRPTRGAGTGRTPADAARSTAPR